MLGSPQTARATPPSRRHYSAIVIGSGFGGAIAALRLGQAGIDTLVLERGKRYSYSPTGTAFNSETRPGSESNWNPVEGTTGVLEQGIYGLASVLTAACVGGGSVVYTGVSLQPTQAHFEHVFPADLSYAELDQIYFPRVRQMLSVSSIPDDIWASPPFTHTRHWDAQVTKAGYRTERTPSTFDWNVIRQELNKTARPSAIIGESNYGCSNGAKHDLSRNYLPAAENTGHVSISPLSNVKSISQAPNGNYTIQVQQLAANATVLDTYELTCEKLFVCAGSINTTKLLVKARETGTLPNLSAAVGTGWGTNCPQYAARTSPMDNGPSQASPCGSSVLVSEGPGVPVPIRIEAWYQPYLATAPVLVTNANALDLDHRGTWFYDRANDCANMNWPWDAEANGRTSAEHLNDRIAEISGAEHAAIPAGVPAAFTGHPLGGCVMGQAADTAGRVMGYTGLYCIDSALMPGNTAATNPSLTIAAVAERAMDRILAEDV